MWTKMGRSIFILSLFIFSSIAWASEPPGIPPKNAQEAFAQSEVVFLGRVEKIFKDSYGYESMAKVKVEKIWKGKESLSGSIQVDGKGGPTYPARIFKLGETYLFYLSVIFDLLISICVVLAVDAWFDIASTTFG